MSRQFRHRATAMALAAGFGLAPLLAAQAAHAGRAQSSRQVVFDDGGGVFDLSCGARPDVRRLRVPAESTVRVVNNTRHRAELRLDGRSQGGIPKHGSAQVVFHRGTVAVSLNPDCMMGDESAPVLVTASPSADPSGPTEPPPVPSPTASSSTSVGPVSTPTASGPPTPPSPSASVTQASATPDSVRPTTRRPPAPHTTASRTSMPDSAGTEPTRRETAGAVATTQFMPRGGATGEHDDDTPAPAEAVPQRSASDDAQLVPVQPTPDPEPSAAAPTEAAAEPVAALEPMPGAGSVGLLALTAAVCVTGVMAGAIRALVAQRASRANMA